MFKLFFGRYLEALLKVEAELRTQIYNANAQIDSLKAEKAALQGKVDRMELVLLPLSSRAGAALVSRPAPAAVREESLGWNDYLKRYLTEQEELDAKSREFQSKEN